MSAHRIVLAGDSAMIVEFADRIDASVNAQAVGLAESVRAAALPYGRSPRFSVSVRPIAAATEEAAWARARRILEAEEARGAAGAACAGGARARPRLGVFLRPKWKAV